MKCLNFSLKVYTFRFMGKSFDISLSANQIEADFIRAVIAKEKWAQQKLYEDHYRKMMGICLRYANNEDDARDILHDGFIKVFNNIKKYKPGTSLSSWISRVMVNTAIDRYRKNVRRRTEDIDKAYNLSIKEADAISQFSAKEILKAIQQLSPAYKTVFNLFVIEGYPHKDISEKMGITESTSRSNLVKARNKLKEILSARLRENEQQIS